MATQLILTVGTNALPIWVAWYHLKGKLGDPSVRFIHTPQTKNEKKLLEAEIKLVSPSAIILPAIPIADPGRLTDIRTRIRTDVVDTRPADCDHFHIHYTGGTKSMGVETVSVIEREIANAGGTTTVNTSYLNPRGSGGPEIVSRTSLHVPDTREGINIDLEDIAKLNGVQFVSPPTQPTTDQISRGEQWLDDGWPAPPACRVPGESDGFVLEYGVYAAFKKALKGRSRNHYQLYRGVTGRRVPRPGRGANPNPFELDVVAVLGYQVILVSCAITDDPGNIKIKAMEGIIRARQLGGDEARCITVCKANNASCARIQSGLEDEMGDSTPHIRVWGESNTGRLPNLQGLTDKFTSYLNDLSW